MNAIQTQYYTLGHQKAADTQRWTLMDEIF